MRKVLLPVVFLFVGLYSFGATFTSIASGDWNTATTWSQSGLDSDGIPDSDDDVVIDAAHTVTVSTTSNSNNVTVNGTVSIASGSPLYIRGDYVMNGVESGTGGIGFVGNPGGTISGTGTFGPNCRYSFSRNTTIAFGTDITKSAYTSSSIGNNVTVTNLGTMSIGQCASGSNATFLNGATGYMKIVKSDHVTSTFKLDASTPGNTVDFTYNNANGLMKSPIGNTFHHLRISGTATKGQMSNLTVNGNFTTIQGCGYNFRNFNLNVKGNFVSATMTYTQQAASVLTLDGTSAQIFACAGNATTPISNLVINNPAGVTCTGGIITISNSITVTSGNFNLGANKITLLSTASSTAFLAEGNGTYSGTMTIRRFVDARTDGYSDMSSPISGGTFAQLDDDFEMNFVPYVQYSSSPSAWGYSESNWDYFAIDASSDAMNPGEGYEVYLDNDGDTLTTFSSTTIDFVGTPNFGDVNYAATFDNDGWNLVGNPYASFIDFTTFSTNAGLGMGASFQYYDESIEDFGIGGAGDEIAAGQGFWIEVAAAGTLTFHENNKTNSTGSSYRSSGVTNELLGLRVKSNAVKQTSNTYFRFNSESTNNYELNSDVSFLKVPAPTAPSLYSLSLDEKKLRLNELPGAETMMIPIHFVAGINAQYEISLLNIESAQFEGYTKIILEDKKLSVFYDLSNSNYSFDGNIEDETDRFVLHLYKNASPITFNASNNDVSFSNSAEGTFVNFNLSNESDANITVFNLAGQEISISQNVTAYLNRQKVEIPTSYHGIYIVRVIIGDKIHTQKFYKN